MIDRHYIPESSFGVLCRCGNIATHKISEMLSEELFCIYHPYTQYLCCVCFSTIFGDVAKKTCCISEEKYHETLY